MIERTYQTTEDSLGISGFSKSKEMYLQSKVSGIGIQSNTRSGLHRQFCSSGTWRVIQDSIGQDDSEKLDSLVMGVETAFLYGDIEEEIFMKSPVGMEEIDPGSSPEDCYQLKKGIY